MTKPRFVPAIFFFLALALLPAQSQAQNLAEIWVMTPEAGNGAGFVEAFRSHMEFRKTQNDPWSWQMWEVAIGEDVGDFWAISVGHDWADFDAFQDSDFAQVAGSHFGATVAPLVGEVSSYIVRGDTTVAHYPTDPGYEVNLINMVTFHMMPGKAMAFNEAMAKTHEAIVGADLPLYYAASVPVIGGKADTYSIAIFGDKWADFAEPDPTMWEVMTDMYGMEEATAIFTAMGEATERTESSMLRFRGDLSNLPEM